jgi:DNA invertase Pin-like site-specific DNA recombinase
MKKAVAIYARVSTDRQTVDMQIHELKEYIKRRGWHLHREFIDQGYSGSDTKRPAFQDMMNEAKKRKFDVLLVWKPDRLSWSMKDLDMVLNELGGLGIDFVSYDNNLDTSTPTGKLVFHVIGAVAEFEKDIIKERVKAGLENAKRKGKKLGRPGVGDFVIDEAKVLRGEGKSFWTIGKQLRISEGAVRKGLKINEILQRQERIPSSCLQNEHLFPRQSPSHIPEAGS